MICRSQDRTYQIWFKWIYRTRGLTSSDVTQLWAVIASEYDWFVYYTSVAVVRSQSLGCRQPQDNLTIYFTSGSLSGSPDSWLWSPAHRCSNVVFSEKQIRHEASGSPCFPEQRKLGYEHVTQFNLESSLHSQRRSDKEKQVVRRSKKRFVISPRWL